jgi:ribosomal L13-like protein
LAYARVWHHVDATDRILGKLAERIALVLMGKHKPIYDPSGSLSHLSRPVHYPSDFLWKYSGLWRLCDRNKLNKSKSNRQERAASTLPETFNVSRWTERDTV